MVGFKYFVLDETWFGLWKCTVLDNTGRKVASKIKRNDLDAWNWGMERIKK